MADLILGHGGHAHIGNGQADKGNAHVADGQDGRQDNQRPLHVHGIHQGVAEGGDAKAANHQEGGRCSTIEALGKGIGAGHDDGRGKLDGPGEKGGIAAHALHVDRQH